MLAMWARFVFRRRALVLVVCAASLIAAAFALARGGKLSTGTTHGIEAQDAHEDVARALGKRAGPSFVAVFSSSTWTTDDPEFFEAMGRALEPLDTDARVASVLSPVEAPHALGDKLVSRDRHRALAVVVLRGDLDTAEADYPAVRALVRPGPLSLACTGELPYRHDLDATLQHDLVMAELVSLPLAVLVLLFVFRSAVAALLPVAVGALAVLSGIAVVLTLSSLMDMPKYAINVASLIGLGVAIDYSLFFVSRYREEIAVGASIEDALVTSMRTSGRAIAFSGVAVGIGLGGLWFFTGSFLVGIGVAGVVVVLLSIAFALSLLPALLALLGPRLEAWTLPMAASARDGRLWERAIPWVMDRPVRTLAAALAVVLALAAPFAELRMASMSVRGLPPSTEARATFEVVRAEFPAQAATRHEVLVTFPDAAITEARAVALVALRDRLAALPGVEGVDSVLDFDPTLPAADAAKLLSLPQDLRPIDVATAMEFTTGDRATVLTVRTRDGAESEASRALVRAIRARRDVADGKLRVAGTTALDLDATAFLYSHLPRAILFVVVVTYLVLLALLGSIVLPLKAVVMNLLSIAGSFGALVYVFQRGHFASILRFEPGPIEPTLPVILFCVVFGLSMDYEVLLLSRMREHWLVTGDNRRAVTLGLARSGRLITSAAAIMVSVFAAFALASFVLLKAMGVGMSVAVALDATLVRLLIVPATMRLFGDLNWWAPRPLARWLDRLGLSH